MRAICYTCPGYGLYDLPVPQLTKDDDVLIRVAYAGVCGSDMNIIRGFEDEFLNIRPGEKTVLGHEASGYVEKLGPAATSKGLKVGDPVVLYYNEHCGKCLSCRNGQEQFCQNMLLRMGSMADYIVQGEQQVFKLPEGTNMLHAAMTEPVSVVMRGLDIARFQPGATVAISGGGGIGLLFTQLARQTGGASITVIEPVAEKRATALQCGADYALDPFRQDVAQEAMRITGGRGFDAVFECSGVPSAIQTCYDILARGGTLELFACYPKGTRYPLDMDSFFAKEARVVGVFQSPYMFPRAIRMLNRIDFAPFEGDVYAPQAWNEAFEARRGGKPQKVLFRFEAANA